MSRSMESKLQEILAHSPQRRENLPYPQRTDDCPSLARFPGGVQDGWGDKRDHVSHCDYCQHRTAKQWVIAPPRVLDVARYLAGTSPDEQAMDIYLAWPDGQRGRQLLKSGYVRALAELLRAASAAESAIASFTDLSGQLARTALGPALATRSIAVQDWLQQLEPLGGPHGAAVATPDREAESYTVTLTADGPLTVVLVASDGVVSISAVAPSDHSERRVRVEILLEAGDALARELTLHEQQEGVAKAEAEVELSNARGQLANSTLLVAWIS